jgi:lipopolysaccharide/colanic/teichoic acid biosynthesis glycosyltransferase
MPQSRRKTEAALAGVLLVLSSPLWLVAAIGIKLSSAGPVFYIAKRAGRRGVPFPMFKFRTMRVGADRASRIARANDPRVFAFGSFLRRLKIDELPQLVNILRGEMAFVGPRPEDLTIVESAYTVQDRETLEVLPGLTSPGAIYYWSQVEPRLSPTDAEGHYLSGPLRTKLDLDRAYLRTATAATDWRVVCETILVLLHVSSQRPARREAAGARR